MLFLASFHSPEAVFQQLSVIYALPSYGAKRLTVVVPYFPTGTMERVTHIGEVATAKSLARMLSATPMAAHGPVQLRATGIPPAPSSEVGAILFLRFCHCAPEELHPPFARPPAAAARCHGEICVPLFAMNSRSLQALS